MLHYQTTESALIFAFYCELLLCWWLQKLLKREYNESSVTLLLKTKAVFFIAENTADFNVKKRDIINHLLHYFRGTTFIFNIHQRAAIFVVDITKGVFF